MFNSNGSNSGSNYNSISVNTSFEFFSSDTSTLSVGAWNSNLSIRITPTTGVDMNGNRMYDKNRAFQTAIGHRNGHALYKGYLEHLEKYVKDPSALMEGESKRVGVLVGRGDKKTMISLEITNEGGQVDYWLVAYSNLDNDNRAMPQNIYRHRFEPTSAVYNYNYESGEGELYGTQSDFESFVGYLSNMIQISPMAAHAIKYDNAQTESYRSRYQGNNNQYGASSGYSGGGWNTSQNGFNKFNPSPASAVEPSRFIGSESPFM